MSRIGIRADANSIIASGHIMRCITIAKELVNLGEDVIFITADREADSYLMDWKHISLNSSWKDLQQELPLLTEEIKAYNIDLLLVDTYRAEYEYFQALNMVVKTAYIDDLHLIRPVNLLINFQVYADKYDYYNDYRYITGSGSEPTKLLLGPEYAPLREQFVKHINKQKNELFSGNRPENYSILVASGGADMYKIVLKITRALLNKDMGISLQLHAVCGGLSNSLPELLVLEKEYKEKICFESMDNQCTGCNERIINKPVKRELKVHSNVSDMAELMSGMDLIVTAAGTMLLESAVMGLPVLFFKTADNQSDNAEYWKKYYIYLGNCEEDTEMVVESAVDFVLDLIKNPVLMKDMKAAAGKVTDGMGARRIAEEIGKLL